MLVFEEWNDWKERKTTFFQSSMSIDIKIKVDEGYLLAFISLEMKSMIINTSFLL
jgi:hypothetical protein